MATIDLQLGWAGYSHELRVRLHQLYQHVLLRRLALLQLLMCSVTTSTAVQVRRVGCKRTSQRDL